MTPSARRLIADFVRRQWLLYTTMAVAAALMGLLITAARHRGVLLVTDQQFVGTILAVAWFLTFIPVLLMEQREIALLPVSRREFWIAKWWLGVAVAPTAVCVVAAPAAIPVLGHVLRPDETAVAVLLSTSYCGALVAMIARWPLIPREGGDAKAITHILLTIAARFIVPIAAPLMLAGYLPVDAATMTLPWMIGVIAAIGMTATGYFHAPGIRPRAGRAVLQTRQRSGRERRWPGDQLVGISRLFWVHGREVFFTVPLALLVIVALDLFGSSASSLRAVLHALHVLPFDRAYPTEGRDGLNIILIVSLGSGYKARELFQRIRALRVLPMSSNGFSLAAGALPIITVTILWAWLIVLHIWAVGSRPTDVRPDLFVLLCGSLAMSQALELAVGRFVAIVALMPPVFIGFGVISTVSPILSLAGLATFAAGVLLFSWTVRRRSKIYKFKPMALMGMPTPQ